MKVRLTRLCCVKSCGMGPIGYRSKLLFIIAIVIITALNWNFEEILKYTMRRTSGIHACQTEQLETAKQILVPPSAQPYDLGHQEDSETALALQNQVLEILGHPRNGFFVEVGLGGNGEALSNTLHLEKNFGWTGLIADGSPLNIEKVKAQHRKVWLAPTPLANKNTRRREKKTKGNTDLSLGSLLKTLKVEVIDYFSLQIMVYSGRIDTHPLEIPWTDARIRSFSFWTSPTAEKHPALLLGGQHKYKLVWNVTSGGRDLLFYVLFQELEANWVGAILFSAKMTQNCLTSSKKNISFHPRHCPTTCQRRP